MSSCFAQRFGLDNAFKRTILDMITNELLQRHAASESGAPPKEGGDHSYPAQDLKTG